jgi:hypothetical protein
LSASSRGVVSGEHAHVFLERGDQVGHDLQRQHDLRAYGALMVCCASAASMSFWESG